MIRKYWFSDLSEPYYFMFPFSQTLNLNSSYFMIWLVGHCMSISSWSVDTAGSHSTIDRDVVSICICINVKIIDQPIKPRGSNIMRDHQTNQPTNKQTNPNVHTYSPMTNTQRLHANGNRPLWFRCMQSNNAVGYGQTFTYSVRTKFNSIRIWRKRARNLRLYGCYLKRWFNLHRAKCKPQMYIRHLG